MSMYVLQKNNREKRAHRLEVTKSITSARYSAQGSFGMKKLTKGVRKELHTRLATLSNRNVDVVIIIAHPTRVLVLMNVKNARLVMNYVGWADIWIHSLKRIVGQEREFQIQKSVLCMTAVLLTLERSRRSGNVKGNGQDQLI